MSDVSEILVRSAETVMKGWCQRVSARDAKGVCVPAYSSRAVQYCASGAIERNAPAFDSTARMAVLRHLALRTRWVGESPFSIIRFNDEVASCPEQVAQLLCEAAGL